MGVAPTAPARILLQMLKWHHVSQCRYPTFPPPVSYMYSPCALFSTYLCSTAHPEPHFPQGTAVRSCEEHAQVYEGLAVQVLTDAVVPAKISRLKTQGAGKFGMLTGERSAEGSESPVKASKDVNA